MRIRAAIDPTGRDSSVYIERPDGAYVAVYFGSVYGDREVVVNKRLRKDIAKAGSKKVAKL